MSEKETGVAMMRHVRPQAEPATAGRRWSGALAEASEQSERSAVSERDSRGNDETPTMLRRTGSVNLGQAQRYVSPRQPAVLI